MQKEVFNDKTMKMMGRMVRDKEISALKKVSRGVTPPLDKKHWHKYCQSVTVEASLQTLTCKRDTLCCVLKGSSSGLPNTCLVGHVCTIGFAVLDHDRQGTTVRRHPFLAIHVQFPHYLRVIESSGSYPGMSAQVRSSQEASAAHALNRRCFCLNACMQASQGKQMSLSMPA